MFYISTNVRNFGKTKYNLVENNGIATHQLVFNYMYVLILYRQIIFKKNSRDVID